MDKDIRIEYEVNDKVLDIEDDALDVVANIMENWKEGVIGSPQLDIDMINAALKVLYYVNKVKTSGKQFDWYEAFSKILDHKQSIEPEKCEVCGGTGCKPKE